MQHPRGVAGLTPGVTAWTREKIAALSREEFRAMQALVDEAGVRSARAQGLPNPITSVVRARRRALSNHRGAVLSPPRHPGGAARPPRSLLWTVSSDREPLRAALFRRPPPRPRPRPPPQDRLAPDQRLYLFCSDATSPLRGPSAVLGILKVGSKNLFVSKHDDPLSPVVEIEPTCVLDFYVHERTQRMGVGGRLFDAFLDAEGRHPGRLAYDRPSEKFLAFLAKNHGLAHFKPQNNNFVVFREYWRVKPRPASAALEAKKAAMRGGRGSRVGLAAAARAKAAAARAERAEAETRRTERTGTAPLDGSSHTRKNENKQNGIFGGGGFGGGNLGGGFGNLGTRPGGARTRINPARPARRFDGFELDDGARVGVRISESSRRRADENDAVDESRARRRSGSGEAAAAARGPPPPRGPERASDTHSAAGPEKPPLDEAPRRAFSGVSLRRTPPPPPVKTTGGVSSSTAGGGSSSPTSAAAADERGRLASLAPRTPPSRGPPKGPPLGGSTPRHSRDPKIPVRVRERGLPLFEDDDEPRRGDFVGGEATRLARSPAPDEPLPPQALARDGGGAMLSKLSNLSNLSHRATFSRRSDDVSRGGRGGNLELDAPRADAAASAAFESAPWGSTLMLSPKMRRERRGRGGERLSVEEEEAQRRLERRLERRPFGEDLGTVESSEYGLSYQRFVRAVKAMGGDDAAGVGAGERARRREAEGAHLGDGERRRRGGHGADEGAYGADEGASGLLGGGADDDDENVSDARRRASLTGGDYAHVGPPAPGYYRARRPDVPAGAMAAHGAAPTYHYRSADAPFLDERGRYPRRYDHAARGRGFRVGVGVDGYPAAMHHHDTAVMNHDTAVMMHQRAPMRARERSSLLGPRNAHASFSYGETQDAFWRARAEGTVALERGGRFNPRREGSVFGSSLHPGGGRRWGDGVSGDSFGRFAGSSSTATKGRESEVVRAGRRAMGGRWARGGDDAWGGGGGYRAG